jgi:hypothetical protein
LHAAQPTPKYQRFPHFFLASNLFFVGLSGPFFGP